MNVFEIEGIVRLTIFLVTLTVSIAAFASSLFYKPEAYAAAGKLTKTTWCSILGAGVVLYFVPVPLVLVNLILLVAALVYFADVRPALANLYRR